MFDTFLLVANRSAMPCRSDEEFAQGPEQPNAVTLPRRRRNAEAGKDKSDAENSEENDSDAEADDDWGESRTVPVPILKRGRERARF